MRIFILFYLLYLTPVFPYPTEQTEYTFKPKEKPKKLCPTSTQRYHNATKKCYKLGEKGPCNENMVFHSENSIFGECDCNFLESTVPLVYDIERDQCWFIYSQAYCPSSSWLTYLNSTTPTCTPDPCLSTISFDEETTTIVEYKGRCVPLHKRTFDCGEGEVLSFVGEAVVPTCASNNEISSRTVYNTRKLSCRVGSRRDRTGKCRRVVVGGVGDY